MTALTDSQAAFARALRDPELPAPDDIRRPVPTAQTRRFNVYRNNFAVSLIEALEATFPAVRKLVGEEFFRGCARVFIDTEPPRSPVLLLYGRGFGDFLDSFTPAATVPYLGDVARLEWARINAYHTTDATPATIDCLATLAETEVGNARFTFHPSFALIRSRWPVVSLWQACAGSESGADVDMRQAEDGIVVRPVLTVETLVVRDGGGIFLARLLADDTLAEAAAAAGEAAEGFDLASHLQGLFAVGAVASISLAPLS